MTKSTLNDYLDVFIAVFPNSSMILKSRRQTKSESTDQGSIAYCINANSSLRTAQ